MSLEELPWNILLMLLSYMYILSAILFSSRGFRALGMSERASRKFLHATIGNLPFVTPFFTSNVYPVLVAAPFIAVTFLASPYSPFRGFAGRMKGLEDITEEGHHLGLVFSYKLLVFLFASKPQVIAAGILPMAYGDTVASIIGSKYGVRRYRFGGMKSMEGSTAMFIASFLSLTFSLVYFSNLYSLSLPGLVLSALAVALVATLVEGLTPMGLDNLTVPLLGALTFHLLNGGI